MPSDDRPLGEATVHERCAYAVEPGDLCGFVQACASPRVEADRYVVYPTGYDDFVHSDKDSWCLSVVNGHAWGWKITRGLGSDSVMAMNRKGRFIVETRGSKHNKARRWPIDEALRIAVEHVDALCINGRTAAEASAEVAARLTATRQAFDPAGEPDPALRNGHST